MVTTQNTPGILLSYRININTSAHRRVNENAVIPELGMIRGREKGQVAALLGRPLLDRPAVRPATINVHVESPPQPVVVVLQEVDEAVVALGPEALTNEVGASRARLPGTDRG